MSNVKERIDEVISYSALIDFIGVGNVKKLQDGFTDLLLNRLQNDLDEYSRFLFYPPDHEDVIEEAFDKVKKKLVKSYSDAMLDVAQKSVEKWKEIALSDMEKLKDKE